jgi:Rps23 Pro-64 3,4-dihydroxylase Tpa1-like proline 4-hydroxylase
MAQSTDDTQDAPNGEAQKQFDDIAASILKAGGLLEQAEGILKRTIEADPTHIAALEDLATIHRGRGDLTAASDDYRRIARLKPDDAKADYLHCVLNGRSLPPSASPQGVWPAPFVRIEGFLSPAEHDLVLNLALEHQGQLKASKIGEGDYNPQERSSWVLSKDVDPLIPWFLPRVMAALPDVLPRLQIAPFLIGEIELQMTVHRTGGHYKTHQDSGVKVGRGRQVAYVYYFHRSPKRFAVGDLLLYDSDVRERDWATAFTRRDVVDNSIVFFPSGCFHQVIRQSSARPKNLPTAVSR